VVQAGGKVRVVLAVQVPLHFKALARVRHGLVLVLARESCQAKGIVSQTWLPIGSEVLAARRLSSQNDEPRSTTASCPLGRVSLGL
jgi:hypothetical protein